MKMFFTKPSHLTYLFHKVLITAVELRIIAAMLMPDLTVKGQLVNSDVGNGIRGVSFEHDAMAFLGKFHRGAVSQFPDGFQRGIKAAQNDFAVRRGNFRPKIQLFPVISSGANGAGSSVAGGGELFAVNRRAVFGKPLANLGQRFHSFRRDGAVPRPGAVL